VDYTRLSTRSSVSSQLGPSRLPSPEGDTREGRGKGSKGMKGGEGLVANGHRRGGEGGCHTFGWTSLASGNEGLIVIDERRGYFRVEGTTCE